MVFDNVPKVMLRVVKEKPHFAVIVRQEYFLETDHVWVFQLTQQLIKKYDNQFIVQFTEKIF